MYTNSVCPAISVYFCFHDSSLSVFTESSTLTETHSSIKICVDILPFDPVAQVVPEVRHHRVDPPVQAVPSNQSDPGLPCLPNKNKIVHQFIGTD